MLNHRAVEQFAGRKNLQANPRTLNSIALILFSRIRAKQFLCEKLCLNLMLEAGIQALTFIKTGAAKILITPNRQTGHKNFMPGSKFI